MRGFAHPQPHQDGEGHVCAQADVGLDCRHERTSKRQPARRTRGKSSGVCEIAARRNAVPKGVEVWMLVAVTERLLGRPQAVCTMHSRLAPQERRRGGCFLARARAWATFLRPTRSQGVPPSELKTTRFDDQGREPVQQRLCSAPCQPYDYSSALRTAISSVRLDPSPPSPPKGGLETSPSVTCYRILTNTPSPFAAVQTSGIVPGSRTGL